METDMVYFRKFYEKGRVLANYNKYSEAIECFQKVVTLDPKFSAAWGDMGNAYLAIGKIQEAVDALVKATMLDPGNLDAWMSREAAHILAGDYTEGIKCLDELIKRDPSNEDAWMDKGKLLLRLDMVQEALECFNEAIKINPSSSAVSQRTALLKQFAENEQYKGPQTKEYVKKIVFAGDHRVGKTSLIRRYVWDLFDERYLSTVGAKITKKVLSINEQGSEDTNILTLMFWDLEGQTNYYTMNTKFFQGTDAAVIVSDITRKSTFDNLSRWADAIQNVTGRIPMVILANKADLDAQAAFSANELEALAGTLDFTHYLTSAKTGRGVAQVFADLVETMYPSITLNAPS